ncbi:MAG: recombination protein RecR [Patescibacteria group bacterium]|jgi:recombination protein RecR|nr:recombination protein RecR [Patescibacteria group bacterium]
MDDHIEQLTRLFLKFPGIGARQAKRFAYFIISQQESYVKNLSSSLLTARSFAQTCTRCYRIYEGQSANAGQANICHLCADTTRDQNTIVVVEKSSDIEVFLKTDYHGLFFVLGALIPITKKSIIDGTNATKLIDRAKNFSNIKEIILAFPLTPNGDHTDFVIRDLLSSLNIKISSLGRGLSTGTELEYADPASLEASLKKRE